MSSPVSNRLLHALSIEERTSLLSQMERVAIPARATLFSSERAPRYAYLLTSGVASVVSEMISGQAVEVSMVGREGMPGSCRLLGSGVSHSRCVMLEAGTAVRMEFSRMQQAFHLVPGLHRLVLQHVQYESMLMERLSACNRVHDAESRLCRWLLMVADRVGEVLLNPTQESMAKTLGTRRTTVTQVASGLQRRGIIRYRRGRLQILNREELQQQACDCYTVSRQLLDGMYAEPAPQSPLLHFKQPTRLGAPALQPRFA